MKVVFTAFLGGDFVISVSRVVLIANRVRFNLRGHFRNLSCALGLIIVVYGRGVVVGFRIVVEGAGGNGNWGWVW